MKIKYILLILLSCCLSQHMQAQSANFDVLSLFADPACSELRDDITEEEITQCPDAFFRELAQKLYDNTYDKEFRVDTFRAYPHPRIMAEKNCIWRYSLLDNPTGIQVEKGQTLVVLVASTHSQSIKLKVRDIDTAPAGEISGEEYFLKTGTNLLTMKEGGLVYVMYHTDRLDSPSAKPVKMHFATGEVSGYYDVEKHAGRWNELLGKAKAKYFDLVGRYAHITAETELFRKRTGNRGDELIGIYDRLVESEQEMLGLKHYDRMMTNRLYMQETWGFGALYAINYMTGYPAASMGDMLDPDVIQGDRALWGPAHEVGHVNQLRPGLYWTGLTEVTNNIMSQYVTKTIFGGHSRLQYTQLLPVYQNYYSKGWTEIMARGQHFCDFKAVQDDNDVMVRLCPFWQLQLYYGEVLGRTPDKQADHGGIYPEIYEYARNKDYSGMNDAEIMLDFVYNASLAARTNLYPFFEHWGIARPLDTLVGDYTSKHMTVTQKMLDELKAKVESLGYPEPDVALEYITDNTVELYRTLPDIVKGEPAVIRRTAYYDGKATNENDEIQLTGWKNVVAFEVRDADDNLICANSGEVQPSEKKVFQLASFWMKGYRLFAVSAKGDRVEVEVPYEGVDDSSQTQTLVAIDEDFSLLPKGESGSINDGWKMLPDEYTHTPGWGANQVYSDNGAIRLNASSSAYLQTPAIDISGNEEGKFTLSLRHRYAASDYLYVNIYAVDEKGEVDTSKRLKKESVGGSTNWEEVSRSYAFDAESCPTRKVVVRLQSYWYQKAWFDDIRIEVPQTATPVSAPSAADDVTVSALTGTYNLMGQRVKPNTRGLIIQNGKKIFRK